MIGEEMKEPGIEAVCIELKAEAIVNAMVTRKALEVNQANAVSSSWRTRREW